MVKIAPIFQGAGLLAQGAIRYRHCSDWVRALAWLVGLPPVSGLVLAADWSDEIGHQTDRLELQREQATYAQELKRVSPEEVRGLDLRLGNQVRQQQALQLRQSQALGVSAQWERVPSATGKATPLGPSVIQRDKREGRAQGLQFRLQRHTWTTGR